VALVAQIQGGTIQPLDRYPWSIRLGNAVVSYARYLGKAIWPVDLGVYYPHPGATLGWGVIAGAGALLAGMTLLALLQKRRRPYVLVGWLWYLGMLIPVIGLVQVGGQAMADRYTYLPLVGPFVAVVWSLGEATGGLVLARRWRSVLAGLVLAVLWALSRRQVGYWRDDLTLWRRAAAVAPESAMVSFQLSVAHLNRANALSDLGKGEEAFEHYREALRLDPSGSQAHLIRFNMGLALDRQGKRAEAVEQYREAVRLRPGFPEALENLGELLRRPPK
jgi:tetratricopeptide (TPR) repeat protein